MKTIMRDSKKKGILLRRSNAEAKILVEFGLYRYVPKHCWKATGRWADAYLFNGKSAIK